MANITTKDVLEELPESLKDLARKIGNFFVSNGRASLNMERTDASFPFENESEGVLGLETEAKTAMTTPSILNTIGKGEQRVLEPIKWYSKEVLQYLPETFIETVKKTPEKIKWGTILTIPKVRDKYIEENPQAAIDFYEDYQKFVGPFVRTMWPTRIPLAIAEKIVGRELAPTYKELSEKYPITTALSGLMGDIYNLTAMNVLTGGIGEAIKIPGPIEIIFPTLSRYIPSAIQAGTTWGMKGILDETMSQFEGGKFDIGKLATSGGKEFLFGTLLAAPLALKSVPAQILGSGAVRAGWTALEGYLKDKTLDRNDLINIGTSAILGMVFSALGVKERVAKMEIEEIYNFSHQQLVIKVGETNALLIEQAHQATVLGRMYPEKSAAEIMEMAKLLPGSYVESKLPTVIEQQIKGQFPSIGTLSENEQMNILKDAMEFAKSQIGQGQPVWSSVLKGIRSVISILPTPSLGLTVKEAPEPKPAAIPKELEPLAIEARKYKSVEEFVKGINSRDLLHELQNKALELGRRTSLVNIEEQKILTQALKEAGFRPTEAEKLYRKVLDKVLKREYGQSLTDFYNQAIKGIKPEVPSSEKPPAPPTGPVPSIEVPPSEYRERGFVTSVKEAFPEQSSKVAGQYIPRSTDEIAIKAKNFVYDDLKGAEEFVETKSKDSAVWDRQSAVASELIKFYADQAAIAPDTVAKESWEQKMADVANSFAKDLTEHGRSIQAASIINRLTPEGQVRFAAREIQKYNEAMRASKSPLAKEIPALTGKQIGNIVKQMKLIEDMPLGIEKDVKFNDLQNKIHDMAPSRLLKKIVTVWKAGLLTGIKTSGLNIFSTSGNIVLETGKDILAAPIDKIISLFTGERKVVFTLRGFGKNFIKEGFQKGWTFLKTGFDEATVMEKLDYKHVSFVNPNASQFIQKLQRVIQTCEEIMFRIVGSQDYPFLYGARARSMYNQAFAQGKNMGLKGKELVDFANDIVKNPNEEMIKTSAIESEVATFHNKTLLGEVGRAIQKVGHGTAFEGVGEIVVPFSRTTSAFFMQVVNYSPGGIVKTIIENIEKGKFDQRQFAQGLARGILGTAIIYIGMQLYKKGLIILDFPQGEREQKLWELEGKKANSLYINGKFRSTQPFGPAGNLLLTGAYFQRGLESTGSVVGALAQSTFGGLKSITDQTFMQGLQNFQEAWNDPERFGEIYFGNLLGSAIPTMISDVARAKDLTERRTRGILERVQARIPYLRESLEPQIDVLGREKRMGGNVLETMIDPTRPSKDISTPLVKELRRLSYAGHKVSPTLLGDKYGYESLTPEQNTALWKRAGEIISTKLKKLIADPRYLALPMDKKAKEIEEFVEKSKLIARVEKVLEVTSGLTGKALKEELSKQKKGGLMTREVFNKFLELR